MRCPTCGRHVTMTDKSYICDCVTVPKAILGKEITPEILHELLTNRQTRVLDGFISKKNNKKFSAALAIEGKEVKFKFGEDQKGGGIDPSRGQEVRIRVYSGHSGSAYVSIKGAADKEFQVNYGHVSSRMAECLACITAAALLKHSLKNIAGIKLIISLNNLDFSRYILKERIPRDKDMKNALDNLFTMLEGFKSWTARYEPEKRPRLAGSPYSDQFPLGVFPGIDVKTEEKDDRLVVMLPPGRPDVQAQFTASIRYAVPDREASYILPLKLRPALMAWINRVKKGVGYLEASHQ